MVIIIPTGYTADIYDGKDVSFKDFALKCARGFGALITLRDNPSAEIPEKFEVSEYYEKRVAEADEELEKAEKMTDEDFAVEAEKVLSEQKEYLTRYIEQKKELRKRYENMLEQVVAWAPPTEDHIELKNMMIDQLKQSIEFDTSTEHSEKKLSELSLETFAEARDRIISGLQWGVDRANKDLSEQKKLVEERTEWISVLRKSLNR